MTGPQQGEFWIVEFRGEVTIARAVRMRNNVWQFVGLKGHYAPDETFRAIRKLDLGALLDRTEGK